MAEDDRTMADLLSINLRRLGHRVAGIAWNGREAVDMALRVRPDLIVMDIHMPILNGLEAARELLDKHPIPIVLSTGVSDAKAVHGAIDLNLVSYLVKPFSPAQLKVALHLAVAQFRALAKPFPIAAAS